MIVVGLMRGTSVDGVDAAVVKIQGAPPDLSVHLLSFTFVPYAAEQRARTTTVTSGRYGTGGGA